MRYVTAVQLINQNWLNN